MQQTPLNAAIMASARALIGTPFLHQGRCGVRGLDCLGVLMHVADTLHLRDVHGRLLARQDRRDYTKCPDGGALKAALDEALLTVPLEQVMAGDIALFSLERNPQHLGIITHYYGGGLGLLHAYASARKVVEHRLDERWQTDMIARYRVPASMQAAQQMA